MLEALTLLWRLGINGVIEIVDEEDCEGIILVQGMPDRNNNKGTFVFVIRVLRHGTD